MESLLPCTCQLCKRGQTNCRMEQIQLWLTVRVHAPYWSQQASLNTVISKDSNMFPHWSHTNTQLCSHMRDSNLLNWSNHFISSACRQNMTRLSTRRVPTLSSSLIIRAPIVGYSLSSPLPAKGDGTRIEHKLKKWVKNATCLYTPVQTERKRVCCHGKSGKSFCLFKDSSAVFLTKWLTVLAVRVSQKMFIRHLGKRAGMDGKEGGWSALRMRRKVCLQSCNYSI